MIKKSFIVTIFTFSILTLSVSLGDLAIPLVNRQFDKFKELLETFVKEHALDTQGFITPELRELINQSFDGATLLHRAIGIAIERHLERTKPDPFVELLLQYHADPNIVYRGVTTPLIVAVAHRYAALVMQLLAHGAHVTIENIADNKQPLWLAITNLSDPLITAELLRYGANPNLQSDTSLIQTLINSSYQDNDLLQCLHLLLLYGATVQNTDFTTVNDIYEGSSLLQAVFLKNDEELRQLLEISQHSLMNQQQRIEHIRTIRRQFESELTIALALAIGQRNTEAVRLLLNFANPMDQIPTITFLNAPHSYSVPLLLGMNSRDLIELLLEHPSHFTPEQQAEYHNIAYHVARSVAVHARIFLPYNQDDHFLPTEVVLHHIVSTQPTRFSRIVEEVYHAHAPDYQGRPSLMERLYMFSEEELTRLLTIPTRYQRFRGVTAPATDAERLDALRRAVEHVKLEWVKKLLPVINPSQLLDILRIAQERARQLEGTTHGILAHEIASLIEARINESPTLLIDYPSVTFSGK